ncbi:L-aspartate oxidase [Halomonas llamarensis]|uniref:L-aspartate oxidase n=1 Tax=Halomonas llamarensis TaxID=2945104 RepID=A0ABT0SRW7_9GAMM|nr:L-aspartate oxidase [Halomonas llamarensis]MCL7930313.1 L-aspartate oxidase [Halomonas llamarensis]
MSTSQSDVLIIGGGVAGLTLALTLAERFHVVLVRPAQDDQGASRWAQGGIAAVLSPDDNLEAHVQDTLIAGDGLCDERAVRFTVENGPAAIHWLIDNGVPFTPDTAPDARYAYHLTREGGHNARRIIHADDATGKAVVETLNRQASAHPHITQRDDVSVIDLLSDDNGACCGAHAINAIGNAHTLLASHTILATGGASGLYQHTTTPTPNSGEGMMMAASLGATLMNLEFQQFHPTCLYDPEGPAFLISEAVRGEGGKLLNEVGERFMPAVDARAELAPRDIVARAIDAEIQQSSRGHVWLDIRHLGAEAIHHHFPTIFAHCVSRGMDITRDPIPVVPAAHYSCGGVATDLCGRTNVTGLYAIGEVACTGLHGANRMASNSLLECLVFARSCAATLLATPPNATTHALASSNVTRLRADASFDRVALAELRATMRATMSQHVAIVRRIEGLEVASHQLATLETQLLALDPESLHPESRRFWHSLRLARLTVLAAQQRHESRGLHYSPDWSHHAKTPRPSRLTLRDIQQ